MVKHSLRYLERIGKKGKFIHKSFLLDEDVCLFLEEQAIKNERDIAQEIRFILRKYKESGVWEKQK